MNYDNPVREALIESDFDWSDPSMIQSVLVALQNPQSLPIKELAAVAGVGLALSFVGSKVAHPVLVGTGLYLLGYYLRGERPSTGWHKVLS